MVGSRDAIAGAVRGRVARYRREARQVGGVCMYAALAGRRELQERGIKAAVIGGSLQWPMATPEEDDGVSATHFAYMWERGWQGGKLSVLQQVCMVPFVGLPEVHCWLQIEDTGELVDFSLYSLHAAAERVLGREATRKMKVPDYIWGQAPENVVYTPVQDATLFCDILVSCVMAPEFAP